MKRHGENGNGQEKTKMDSPSLCTKKRKTQPKQKVKLKTGFPT